MGYSVVNVDEIEPAGPGGAVRFVRRERGGAGPDGMAFISVGARRGGYESRGSF